MPIKTPPSTLPVKLTTTEKALDKLDQLQRRGFIMGPLESTKRQRTEDSFDAAGRQLVDACAHVVKAMTPDIAISEALICAQNKEGFNATMLSVLFGATLDVVEAVPQLAAGIVNVLAAGAQVVSAPFVSQEKEAPPPPPPPMVEQPSSSSIGFGDLLGHILDRMPRR